MHYEHASEETLTKLESNSWDAATFVHVATTDEALSVVHGHVLLTDAYRSLIVHDALIVDTPDEALTWDSLTMKPFTKLTFTSEAPVLQSHKFYQ